MILVFKPLHTGKEKLIKIDYAQPKEIFAIYYFDKCLIYEISQDIDIWSYFDNSSLQAAIFSTCTDTEQLLFNKHKTKYFLEVLTNCYF